MDKNYVTTIKNGVANCIKAVGQSLIERADDISRDIKDVHEIDIQAKIVVDEVQKFEVNKVYFASLNKGEQ